MKKFFQYLAIVFFVVILVLIIWGRLHHRQAVTGESPYKIYVAMGFHSNFYHSWRGDTPDEAGFGTDIRFARAILDALDEANEQGLDARGYWDSDVYYTLQTIIPEYAPDIIERIQRRVNAGLDEVLLAPFNNGIFSAMTEEEMRKAVSWSISNPWGSGNKDLFGTYTPLIRPNESMFTPGVNQLLKEEGVEGVLLAYSGYPFTSYSNFIEPLPPERRYNPMWLRTERGGEKIIWFPIVSIGDVLNHQSLENWMLELRKLQVKGQVQQDMILHINFDTDSEAWIPPKMPWYLQWFPNSGGVKEYIHYVNKYDWAEFTTPGEYLETHVPQGEVFVAQDCADGSFDGHYSWAEKFTSHETWTKVEQARLARQRIKALANYLNRSLPERDPMDIENQDHLLVLSTTHFGMSTPMLNEEREAAANRMADRNLARETALLKTIAAQLKKGNSTLDRYQFLVVPLSNSGYQWLRVPVVLPIGKYPAQLITEMGETVVYSWINTKEFSDGTVSGEIAFEWTHHEPMQFSLTLSEQQSSTINSVTNILQNDSVRSITSKENGIASLTTPDQEETQRAFLAPFIHYNERISPADQFIISIPQNELLNDLQRLRLTSKITINAIEGLSQAHLQIDLSLPKNSPGIIADITIDYPHTEKTELLTTAQQRLRRLFDFGWVEVAPFQIYPNVSGTREQPIKIWKHNYLGVTSSYELNYATINPNNGELDSFNSHVTAGWVAVSDRQNGLLIASDADTRHSYAFAPMRLREQNGKQVLSINPFGSYHGKQLDYSHMGGIDLGYKMGLVTSSHIRPNGPSYNGEHETFSLMLAPYHGDEPPVELQHSAKNFFYSAAVVYTSTPTEIASNVPAEIETTIVNKQTQEMIDNNLPLPVPQAFLASPTVQAVDLVWDEAYDPRITAIEVNWKISGNSNWHSQLVEKGRVRIDMLSDGVSYDFRIRSVATKSHSEWSKTQVVTCGAAEGLGITEGVKGLTFGLMLETFYYGLIHAFTSP
jgi:hypothetical protein